jgi:hypothetical protein
MPEASVVRFGERRGLMGAVGGGCIPSYFGIDGVDQPCAAMCNHVQHTRSR